MGGAQEEREGEGEAGSRVGPLAPGFAKGRVRGHGQRDVRASREETAEPEGDPEPLSTGSRKPHSPVHRAASSGASPARLLLRLH